jgi:hypothetical protein
VEQVLSWTGKTNDWYAVVRCWTKRS